jgi:hypothetical protein
MRAGFRLLLAIACALAALFGRASSAAAQTPSADVQQQGPLVLTPVRDRVVFSPDVEVTEIGHRTATLVGLYMGKRFDDRIFIGGGLSFLVDPHHEAGMFYAGVLTGWRMIRGAHFGLEARLFAGAGEGESIENVQTYAYPNHSATPVVVTQPAWIHNDFWMAEPKIVFNIDLTDTVRLNLGAGYRATTSGCCYGHGYDYGYGHGYGDLFNGATGTIGFEFDIGR